jgi:hypothetical protein
MSKQQLSQSSSLSPTKAAEQLLDACDDNATTTTTTTTCHNRNDHSLFENNRRRCHRHHPVPIVEEHEISEEDPIPIPFDAQRRPRPSPHSHHYFSRDGGCFPSLSSYFAIDEANGLALDMYARATVAMCSLFLGPALLDLANDAARCGSGSSVDAYNEDSLMSSCDNTIYGFRPSSLLTNLATISGILSSIALPFFGSIVDHTPYRRHVGAYTAIGLILVKSIEGIVLGPSTWFFITGLQILSALLYQIHITASYAYVSELSTDSHVQAEYNSTFSIILYISTILFMVQVLGLSKWWDVQNEDVATARIALLISAATCTVLLPPAWIYLFPDRPAKKMSSGSSSQSRPDVSLFTIGFYQVWITSQQIRCRYPALRSLLCAIAFSEAASGALISVSTTYMKQNLNMNAHEIGSVFFVVLLS